MTTVRPCRRPALPVIAALVAAALLGGCAKARGVLGLEKTSPDEFAVVSQAPLAMPPNLDLRPPKPGAARPQEPAVRDQARDALLANVGRGGAAAGGRGSGAGGAAASAQPRTSAGERAFLDKVGVADVNPGIRNLVDRETALFAREDVALTERLMFWAEKPEPGVVVDPAKESQRLREAAAVGRPPNQGDVPIIERRKRGLLEGLF